MITSTTSIKLKLYNSKYISYNNDYKLPFCQQKTNVRFRDDVDVAWSTSDKVAACEFGRDNIILYLKHGWFCVRDICVGDLLDPERGP